MNIKYCPRCKENLDIDKFTKNPSRKDGLQHYCRECLKLYRKEHYNKVPQQYKDRAIKARQKLKEFYNSLKQDAKCSQCGVEYPNEPYLFDFDHIDPALKLYTVAEMVSKGNWKKLKDEVSKCQLLCVICHRRKTFNYVSVA
jgi:hypothetical protein